MDSGEVAEWSNAAVLKTAIPQGIVGSNPTLSASFELIRQIAPKGRLQSHPLL